MAGHEDLHTERTRSKPLCHGAADPRSANHSGADSLFRVIQKVDGRLQNRIHWGPSGDLVQTCFDFRIVAARRHHVTLRYKLACGQSEVSSQMFAVSESRLPSRACLDLVASDAPSLIERYSGNPVVWHLKAHLLLHRGRAAGAEAFFAGLLKTAGD
jgi:hypothetical protein